MSDSPVKHKPTSRVIDSLHSEIDSLKSELEDLRMSNRENKKKATLLASKNDSLVDQLANGKHENDMINALLKRKERRIADLEEQFDELSSLNDSLKLSAKSLKIRCENLQELSASSTAEYERLKIAYDAMIAAQAEYKRHYQKELKELALLFESYKAASQNQLQELSERLASNDKDVDTLIDSLTNKRKVMDNLYVNRNKAVLGLLATLAKAAQLHGEESKAVLKENVDTINLLRTTYPDLQDKIGTREPFVVDLNELLNESEVTEPTVAEVEAAPTDDNKGLGIQRNTSTRRRRHKRQSMRISPEPASIEERAPEALPKLRSVNRSTSEGRAFELHNGPLHYNSQNQRSYLGQRQSSSASTNSQNGGNSRNNYRIRSSQNQGQDLARTGNRNYSSGQSSISSNASANKNKRRLFCGGSSNFNSGSSERRALGKSDA